MISVILWLILGNLCIQFLGRRYCFFCRLGCGGRGVLLEPVPDLAGVAAEDGAGLADVGGEEEHRRANRRHRHNEVGERHRRLLSVSRSRRSVCRGGGGDRSSIPSQNLPDPPTPSPLAASAPLRSDRLAAAWNRV